jgi:hypothetical protein
MLKIKLMKILITLLFTITGTFAFGQNEGKILRKAFKKNSTAQLKQFFQDWNNAIQPIAETEWANLNDIHKECYSAFTAFYQPDNLVLLGGSEMGNDIYENVEFLIVQDNIEIFTSEKVYYSDEEKEEYIVDFVKNNVDNDSTQQMMLKRDEAGKLSKDVLETFSSAGLLELETQDSLVAIISDFRPVLDNSNKQALYLTKKYTDILYKFLGKKRRPFGKGGIMKPASAAGKSARRKEFLENYIKIFQGHWGGYWQLHSYPTATSITFDHDMKFAKVDFRLVYEGGVAILKKEKGKWILVTAYKTWIE